MLLKAGYDILFLEICLDGPDNPSGAVENLW
jgi:hypothetical protein